MSDESSMVSTAGSQMSKSSTAGGDAPEGGGGAGTAVGIAVVVVVVLVLAGIGVALAMLEKGSHEPTTEGKEHAGSGTSSGGGGGGGSNHTTEAPAPPTKKPMPVPISPKKPISTTTKPTHVPQTTMPTHENASTTVIGTHSVYFAAEVGPAAGMESERLVDSQGWQTEAIFTNKSAILPSAPTRRRAVAGTLFCFLDDRSEERTPGFRIRMVPFHLCDHVAYCCAVIRKNGSINATVKATMLPPPSAHPQLHVAIGGHRSLPGDMDAALQDPVRLASNIVSAVLSSAFEGLVFYVQNLDRLGRADKLHAAIMSVDRVMVTVVLPTDLRQQMRYFRPEEYARTEGMMVIVASHDLLLKTPGYATCLSPRWASGSKLSLEFVFKTTKTVIAPEAEDDSKAWTSLQERLLMSLSFGALQFQLEDSALHDYEHAALFVKSVGYDTLCAKKSWHRWHDEPSDCYVAWDGNRTWMSSVGPRSVGFIDSKPSLGGVAVFDIDSDDFLGNCGRPFPLLNTLRSVLNPA